MDFDPIARFREDWKEPAIFDVWQAFAKMLAHIATAHAATPRTPG
jgi:hypothetical protein